jgi:hypothetical protein
LREAVVSAFAVLNGRVRCGAVVRPVPDLRHFTTGHFNRRRYDAAESAPLFSGSQVEFLPAARAGAFAGSLEKIRKYFVFAQWIGSKELSVVLWRIRAKLSAIGKKA